MPSKNECWLDQTGLNLIRIAIGSYFMAISLDLVDGVDPGTLLLPYLARDTASLAGNSVLLGLSLAFMLGAFLRIVALTLALFVFCSSVAANGIGTGFATVSAFWRDVALACAVMLCYASLRRREMRYAAMTWRRGTTRLSRIGAGTVRPRRVCLPQKSAARSPADTDCGTVPRPAIPPIPPLRRSEQPETGPARRRPGKPVPDPHAGTDRRHEDGEADEPENIFSNI